MKKSAPKPKPKLNRQMVAGIVAGPSSKRPPKGKRKGK